MILTVTLNAALDVTYETPELVWGGSNRVTAVRRRAGGKGINVARVAAALGEPVALTGLLGGQAGDLVRRDLAAAGLPDSFAPIDGETRHTLTVVAAGHATVFNETGPHISPADWTSFLDRYRALLPGASVAVLSGSLPPGIPADAYAVLARLAAAADVPAILDADAEWLARGAAGRPAVVTPNAAELAGATGEEDPAAGARAIRSSGARSALVSLGPAGLLAVTPAGTWRAAPPQPLPGNPTGAGDAATAAVARGLAAGAPWPDILRHAAALSAAAVRTPVAGEFDPATYNRLLPEIDIRDVGDN